MEKIKLLRGSLMKPFTPETENFVLEVLQDVETTIPQKQQVFSNLTDQVPLESLLRFTQTIIDSFGILYDMDFFGHVRKMDTDGDSLDDTKLLFLSKDFLLRMYRTITRSSEESVAPPEEHTVQRYFQAFQNGISTPLPSTIDVDDHPSARKISPFHFMNAFQLAIHIPAQRLFRLSSSVQSLQPLSQLLFGPVERRLQTEHISAITATERYLQKAVFELKLDASDLATLFLDWFQHLPARIFIEIQEGGTWKWKDSNIVCMMKHIGLLLLRYPRDPSENPFFAQWKQWCLETSDAFRSTILAASISTFSQREQSVKVKTNQSLKGSPSSR